MFKIIAICIYLFQYITADCPETKLDCYNSKDGIIGDITVGQCWKWSMLACVPCSALISVKEYTNIDLKKYIHFCRYYYPNTEQVQYKANMIRIRDIIRKFSLGKRDGKNIM